jgi:BlaI family transcriptional regulator, penicillinase repressor
MRRRPALSKAEIEVVRIVWNLGEATVRRVFEAFPANRAIDFTTVQTYLRRVEAKGYLKSHRQGRALVYRSHVQPDQVIRETVGDLVNRLFDGQTVPLLHHLIRDRSIGKAEIEELRKMIDQLEGDCPDFRVNENGTVPFAASLKEQSHDASDR